MAAVIFMAVLLAIFITLLYCCLIAASNADDRLCKKYDVDAAIIFAVIEAESGCDPNCVGDNGRSYGLMQIMEECHHERCVRLGADNLFNPYQNVLVGIDFFAELMNMGHGIDWALSWYNSGQGEPTAYALQIQNRAEELREGSMQEVKTSEK